MSCRRGSCHEQQRDTSLVYRGGDLKFEMDLILGADKKSIVLGSWFRRYIIF